jgi:hypothetical protein
MKQNLARLRAQMLNIICWDILSRMLHRSTIYVVLQKCSHHKNNSFDFHQVAYIYSTFWKPKIFCFLTTHFSILDLKSLLRKPLLILHESITNGSDVTIETKWKNKHTHNWENERWENKLELAMKNDNPLLHFKTLLHYDTYLYDTLGPLHYTTINRY